MKRTITAIAVLFNTLIQVEPTIAQMIQWEAVPETDSFTLIGINTWVRQDEQITFDAAIDGEYVRAQWQLPNKNVVPIKHWRS